MAPTKGKGSHHDSQRIDIIIGQMMRKSSVSAKSRTSFDSSLKQLGVGTTENKSTARKKRRG